MMGLLFGLVLIPNHHDLVFVLVENKTVARTACDLDQLFV